MRNSVIAGCALVAMGGLMLTGEAQAQPRTLQDALAAAYSNNPTLQAARAQLRATDESVPQALAGWRPTVVLSTTADQEKKVKDDLPMLRSVAVRALSAHTMSEAQELTVEKYAEQLNSTFAATYDKDKLEKPFSEVMIGKLIIE